ncbi:C2 domain-containing protein [Hordeum vulgare]|nr:C2 domain-containing protein [Hordeum vulgare]
MVINSDKKFRAQYAAIKAHGGIEVIEEHGEEVAPWPWGKTNLKKEDTRDAASIALHATLEGMMSKKDRPEEKRWQDKEEQMNAFMKI